MQNHGDHIKGETKEEKQEKLVVSIPQTVVHKCAMMVEPLHTLVAIIAVESIFGPQIFTVNTYIVQMELLVD